MKKILIATDSTSGLTIEEANKYGIALLPLSVIVDGKEYRDLYDITTEEVYEYDKKKANLSTTQPNLGYLEETMKQWKEENYDAIICISLAHTFSGTYQAIKMMGEEIGLSQLIQIDSSIVASPMKHASILAKKMVDEGHDVDEIILEVNKIFDDTVSFLLPETLDNLKRGGRITGAAAAMSSLLKIKPLLYLERRSGKIEKHSVHRTENKVFKTIIDEFKKRGVTSDTHMFYIPHAVNLPIVERFIAFMKNDFPNMEYEILDLPAVLTTHAGIGAFAVQSVLKF